ncbi:hypothetical protein FOL47_009761 [Perkinsus chesapeaki]|uniref:Uncharacterized protein n=1 Tax=Perkinsus chesapeaki TaxID=330153 RepID=A0A7J6MR91_PERCH|nr:hypothetical protein FOL47_009761 [Perkinsus chesapeaki]
MAMLFYSSEFWAGASATMPVNVHESLDDDRRKCDDDEQKDTFSDSFMDDVTHMDNLSDLTKPFIAERKLEPIAADHDTYFNETKRQFINIIQGDVDALGLTYSNYGEL